LQAACACAAANTPPSSSAAEKSFFMENPVYVENRKADIFGYW
jgi:hypothetical protein